MNAISVIADIACLVLESGALMYVGVSVHKHRIRRAIAMTVLVAAPLGFARTYVAWQDGYGAASDRCDVWPATVATSPSEAEGTYR